MSKIVTVDITLRLKIEMAEGEDVYQILNEMDIDAAWPESQAVVVSQEIMDQEVSYEETPYSKEI